MQDRYTGDIGDFVKYGLLRALSYGLKLGVAWYLYPDESHNDDGRHVEYLHAPKKWRHRDECLYDGLKAFVEGGSRQTAAIEQAGLLGNAKFSRELLNSGSLAVPKRRVWRSNWFSNAVSDLDGCEIVFADPDNGLCEDSKFGYGKTKDWKRLPLSEALALAAGRAAVFYHHNSRRPGGHDLEVDYWIEQLGSGTQALRWRAISNRTFFIVNPTPIISVRLQSFAALWGPEAELHG